MKVLIPGIAGKLAQKVALALMDAGHTVVGIDRRPWRDAPKEIEVYPSDIRKRAAEDAFRKFRPDTVIHMATITHLTARSGDHDRVNLGGTRAVIEHCNTYGVENVIVVARHTYYGAAPDSPLYHTEDEPPLEVTSFPELADLVAADLFAGSALWRFPKMNTCVLRMVYTLGPTKHGTLASFLSRRRVPTILGFDPLFQFMHEDDVVRAIVLALEKRPRGVFNVAGPEPAPLSVIIRQTGRTEFPIPEPLVALALGRFGLPFLPRGALNHIKYSVVVDGSAFKKATGFEPKFDQAATLEAYRKAAPLLD
ncbi:MAG: SDR family oxidoreductase [Polyangiaceae bacterium]